MKRTLSAMLALIFVLALCAAASAEVYTHPVAGYGFTVPEGWMAIDGEKATSILESGKAHADLSEEALAQLTQVADMPIVMLYEKGKTDPVFMNNMNVTVVDLGEVMTMADLLEAGSEIEASYQATLANYVTSTPMSAIGIGKMEAAIMGGEYVLNGNLELARREARFLSGTSLYTVTLTAKANEVETYEPVLFTLVGTFVLPE